MFSWICLKFESKIRAWNDGLKGLMSCLNHTTTRQSDDHADPHCGEQRATGRSDCCHYTVSNDSLYQRCFAPCDLLRSSPFGNAVIRSLCLHLSAVFACLAPLECLPQEGSLAQSSGKAKEPQRQAENFGLPAIESLGFDFLKPPGDAKEGEVTKPDRPKTESAAVPVLPLPFQIPGPVVPQTMNPLLPPLPGKGGVWPGMSLFPESVGPIDLFRTTPTMPLVLPQPEKFTLPELLRWDGSLPRSIVSGPKIRVKAFRFEGNTVFSSEELEKVVQPFLERADLASEDLEGARSAITQHYVKHDYVTSGATLPDQQVKDGIVTLKIIEGRVVRIQYRDRGRLREGYLNRQLNFVTKDVLNMSRLRDELQILQRNPNISRILAQVKPDLRLGEAYLDVDAGKEGGFYAGVEAHNRRPPSIGAEQLEVLAGTTNLTGNSDSLDLRAGLLRSGIDELNLSRGRDFTAQYAIELPWWHTTVGLLYQSNSYVVIEEPFTDLGIDGQSAISRASLQWALKRKLEVEWTLGLALDYRTSETAVLDLPFNLTPGSIDGETELWVARTNLDYTNRSRKQVLALRGTLSAGLDGTDDGTDRNARFYAAALNGQWIRRLGDSDTQFVLKGGGQWSNDPLLALEQTSIGGVNTVRGYLENQLVRDWGGFLSAEVRIPLWRSSSGISAVYLASFVDAGGGWNLEEIEDKWSPGEFDWIAGAGAGVLFQFTRNVEGQVYWGYPLVDKPATNGDNLQAQGIYFSLRVTWF